MKRLIFFWSGWCLLFSSLYCLPVGNPSAPNLIREGFFISPKSALSIRLGYEGNFVSDRRLKQYSEGIGNVDEYKLDGNFGTFILNYQNRFDIYGVFGESRIRSNWRIEFPSNTFSQIEIETKYGFSWAVGGKIIFFEWQGASLSVGGRYAKARPRVLWETNDGTPISLTQSRCKFKEWQADIGLSYKIDLFVPYIAATYAQSYSYITSAEGQAISNSGKNFLHMKSRDLFGMTIGCGLVSIKNFMLNVESRLFCEEGVTVVGELRF